MKDLLNTYKQKAVKKSDYFEPTVKTRKENVINTRKEVQQSGMLNRYNFTM